MATAPDTSNPAVPRSPWPRIAVGFAVLAVVVLALEIIPSALEATDLAAQAREARARITEAERVRAALPALMAERERLEGELGLAGGAGSGLLGMISARAEGAGVVVRRIEPGAPETRGRLTVQLVRVDVRGTGHGVGHFVDELERSGRLVRVLQVNVRGAAARAGVAVPGVEATVEAEVVAATGDGAPEEAR